MAIAALYDFGTPPAGRTPQDSKESYDRVTRELMSGGWPETASDLAEGLLAHFVGSTQDGRWMIVNVYESQEAVDRHMEQVAPLMQQAVKDAGGPPPQVEMLELHNVLT